MKKNRLVAALMLLGIMLGPGTYKLYAYCQAHPPGLPKINCIQGDSCDQVVDVHGICHDSMGDCCSGLDSSE